MFGDYSETVIESVTVCGGYSPSKCIDIGKIAYCGFPDAQCPENESVDSICVEDYLGYCKFYGGEKLAVPRADSEGECTNINRFCKMKSSGTEAVCSIRADSCTEGKDLPYCLNKYRVFCDDGIWNDYGCHISESCCELASGEISCKSQYDTVDECINLQETDTDTSATSSDQS